MNDKQLMTDFASALEQAAALARKIAEDGIRVELKLDAETFGRVVYRTSHDSPEASASTPADS